MKKATHHHAVEPINKLLSNLKAYDFARPGFGGIKRGIDIVEASKALRKIADSLETNQVLLREVSILTKVQEQEYVSTTVILTIVEKQEDPGRGKPYK